jgi:hypothetical protein
MEILTTVAEADNYVGRCRIRVFRGESVAGIVADQIKEARGSAAGRACDIHIAGSVANCYNYPATTQVLCVAAWADGRAIVLTNTIPANKVTRAGAAAATVGEAARAVCDKRYGAAAKAAEEAAMWQRLEELAAAPGNLWMAE